MVQSEEILQLNRERGILGEGGGDELERGEESRRFDERGYYMREEEMS